MSRMICYNTALKIHCNQNENICSNVNEYTKIKLKTEFMERQYCNLHVNPQRSENIWKENNFWNSSFNRIFFTLQNNVLLKR